MTTFHSRSSDLGRPDPLSQVLSLLDLQSSLSASLITGGDWAIRFAPYAGIKFTAILRGSCWLTVEGVTAPIELKTGDCYLLSDGREYRLGSDLECDAVAAHDVFIHAIDGVVQYGKHSDVLLIAGRFSFDQANAPLLIDSLPPLIFVDAHSHHAAVVRWTLEHLATELSSTTEIGASLIADHLAHVLLIQALRAYMASEARFSTGWLGALSDPDIGRVIGSIHHQPDTRWTVASLAAIAGMSRSAFALRFKKLVGSAPLDYVLQWRMRIARSALRTTNAPVSEIGRSLGYDSESTFSNTFKRIVGCAPTFFRKQPTRSA
jgi:AraC-like DNA-binding protein